MEQKLRGRVGLLEQGGEFEDVRGVNTEGKKV